MDTPGWGDKNSGEDESDRCCSLFPNPATEQVTLASTLLHEVRYSIYTLDGRFIESGTFTGSKVCGIAHYTPGLYLVQLQADGQQQTIKWVVE